MRKASLSEDSLLRLLIASIGEMLARVLALTRAGQFQQARAEIDQRLEELLGVQADLVRRLADDKIVEMLTLQDYLDTASLFSVAELFYVDGQLLLAQGDRGGGRARLGRSLNLHLEVAFADNEKFPGSSQRVDELSDLLGQELSEETLFSLAGYFEQVGKYRRADQAWQILLAITPYQADIRNEQKDFHRRLLELPDEALQAGGVSRVELQRWLNG
ncbi:MAG: hypothetical protein JW862_18945 [Anaerolineales bacterium]|nr:hypothetical protein [Anaerolineales bacterium]